MRQIQWYSQRCDSIRTSGATSRNTIDRTEDRWGKGLQYYSHRTMPYLLEVAPYDKYNGIFKLDAVIAWKLMALYPEMEILRERPSFVWVFCLIYSIKSLKVPKISYLQMILGY